MKHGSEVLAGRERVWLTVHRFTNAASGHSGEALFAGLARKQRSGEDGESHFNSDFSNAGQNSPNSTKATGAARGQSRPNPQALPTFPSPFGLCITQLKRRLRENKQQKVFSYGHK